MAPVKKRGVASCSCLFLQHLEMFTNVHSYILSISRSFPKEKVRLFPIFLVCYEIGNKYQLVQTELNLKSFL